VSSSPTCPNPARRGQRSCLRIRSAPRQPGPARRLAWQALLDQLRRGPARPHAGRRRAVAGSASADVIAYAARRVSTAGCDRAERWRMTRQPRWTSRRRDVAPASSVRTAEAYPPGPRAERHRAAASLAPPPVVEIVVARSPPTTSPSLDLYALGRAAVGCTPTRAVTRTWPWHWPVRSPIVPAAWRPALLPQRIHAMLRERLRRCPGRARRCSSPR
jgi:hypothetical protein